MTDTLNIRNCVRAIILRGDKILLLRKVYEDGREQHVLPGGAQDFGETLEDALHRECEEEIGERTTIIDLMYLADYFKPRPQSSAGYRHQVEYLFRCKLPDSYEPHNGLHPDKHQHSVVWVDLAQLARVQLSPAGLRQHLGRIKTDSHPVYLGTLTHD